ncbi:hypothetical protein FDUTEX481_06210 [Tolypothrix sp. PCC 7601]|nr:hypothetical protein FDUTEX481_06210 [Tolypothrix sp. PCC 7601]
MEKISYVLDEILCVAKCYKSLCNLCKIKTNKIYEGQLQPIAN